MDYFYDLTPMETAFNILAAKPYPKFIGASCANPFYPGLLSVLPIAIGTVAPDNYRECQK